MNRNLLITMNARKKHRTYVMVLMLVSAMVFTSSGGQMASAKRVVAPVQPLYSPQNPELDSTFHFDGKVTSEFGPNSEEALAIAVQPDGKIIAAGFADNMVNSPITYSDFALARYNSDGSPDDGSPNDTTPHDSFGNQGKVITDFNRWPDVVNDLAIQPDGKIVAVGYASNSNNTHGFGMARYNTDGTLDNTFGTSGKVTTEFGPNRSEAEAVAIQTDGKIVLAGHNFAIPGWSEDHVALARYNSDGTLDRSFDGDGMVQSSLGGRSCSNNSSRAYDLAIDAYGRLVIVGHAGINGGTPDTCSVTALTVARYTQFGQLDPSFNGRGVVYTNFSSLNFPRNLGEAVALQPDGKILAAGSVQINPMGGLHAFAVARYNSDGSLDSTFGKEGKMITTVGTNNTAYAHSMAVESGGRILLAGSKGIPDSLRQRDFFLARYNPNGFLDDSFGVGGTFSVDFGNTDGRGANNDRAAAIAVQPDGRIVMAGSSGSHPDLGHFVAGRLRTQVTDLAISMSVSTNDVVTGTNFTYTITATNLGPNMAEAVEITDVLPPELTFVSSDPVTDGQDNHRILRLDSLDSGSSVTLTIEATVSCLAEPGKVIANTARVTSLIQDLDSNNNSVTAEGIAWVPLPIKCSPDIVSNTPVVHYPPPKISDNWPDVISVHCSPSSGATFPVGTTTVQCVATDARGNTASCRFNVTVAMPSTK